MLQVFHNLVQGGVRGGGGGGGFSVFGLGLSLLRVSCFFSGKEGMNIFCLEGGRHEQEDES